MFAQKKFFIILLIVGMTAKPCFAHRLLEAATATTSTRPKPTGNDKICQDELGDDYVWDDYIQTCVECTSCTPEALDPHCVTCRALGIIQDGVKPPSSGDTAPQPDGGSSTPTMTSNSTMTTSSSFSGIKTPSSGDTTPQPDGGSSTPQPPTHTMTSDSTMTTSSSFSGIKTPSSGDTTPQLDGGSSTSQANVTNDDNKGSKALWILPCLGLLVPVILILRKCYFAKSTGPPTPLSKEETGPPAECHPMIVLSTDDSGNQAPVAV